MQQQEQYTYCSAALKATLYRQHAAAGTVHILQCSTKSNITGNITTCSSRNSTLQITKPDDKQETTIKTQWHIIMQSCCTTEIKTCHYWCIERFAGWLAQNINLRREFALAQNFQFKIPTKNVRMRRFSPQICANQPANLCTKYDSNACSGNSKGMGTITAIL